MKNTIAYIVLILSLSSCSAVFEKSIKDKSVDIYIPADSFKTKVYNQQFYWEKVDGATSYRVQIASPSFNTGLIQQMVLDTITTANAIMIVLNPGEYEWRIRAQNGGSETVYFTRKLFVDATTFDQRPILIKTPSTSPFVTYENSIQFEWFAVLGAQNYTIEIDTLNGNFKNPILTTVDYTQLAAYASIGKRGSYKWRMFADSMGVKSLYSSTGFIDYRIDTASLFAPQNNDVNVSQNPDLTWQEPSKPLTSDKFSYELYLYHYNSTNKTFESVTDYPQADPKPMPIIIESGVTKQLLGLTKGKTYYWAIKVKDQYNVTSQLTSKRKFSVSL